MPHYAEWLPSTRTGQLEMCRNWIGILTAEQRTAAIAAVSDSKFNGAFWSGELDAISCGGGRHHFCKAGQAHVMDLI
ncbi:MAG: hypothetical protein LBQ44_07595 [Treponema sp.]|nr:hypothetical protein [Treponema sp.]